MSGSGAKIRRGLGLLLAGALSACRSEAPPEVVRLVPADAVGFASLDVEALLAWAPIARDRKRLLGTFADALLEASESCDVGLDQGRAIAAWSPDALTVAVTADGIGGSSTLACLAGNEEIEAVVGSVALETADDAHTIVAGEHTMTAHAPSDDTLVIVVPRTEEAKPAAEVELGVPDDSSLADALARVDASQPLWAVSVDAESTPWSAVLVGGQDIALTVAFEDEGAAFEVHGGWSEDGDADALRSAFDAALASVYLPASVATRMELDTDGGLSAEVELTRGELYAADLRWIGAPPPPREDKRGDDRPEEVEALLAQWAERSAVDNAKVAMSVPPEPENDLLLGKYEKIGVSECDDYIEHFGECIEDKMPEAAKETSLKALETSIDAWRKAATTPRGAGGSRKRVQGGPGRGPIILRLTR